MLSNTAVSNKRSGAVALSRAKVTFVCAVNASQTIVSNISGAHNNFGITNFAANNFGGKNFGITNFAF
jgi:hypothetical protein